MFHVKRTLFIRYRLRSYSIKQNLIFCPKTKVYFILRDRNPYETTSFLHKIQSDLYGFVASRKNVIFEIPVILTMSMRWCMGIWLYELLEFDSSLHYSCLRAAVVPLFTIAHLALSSMQIIFSCLVPFHSVSKGNFFLSLFFLLFNFLKIIFLVFILFFLCPPIIEQ